MVLELKVIPGAKKDLLKQEGSVLKIYLRAPALDGRANEALTSFLAAHFSVRSSQVKIIKGLRSRHKVVEIIEI